MTGMTVLELADRKVQVKQMKLTDAVDEVGGEEAVKSGVSLVAAILALGALCTLIVVVDHFLFTNTVNGKIDAFRSELLGAASPVMTRALADEKWRTNELELARLRAAIDQINKQLDETDRQRELHNAEDNKRFEEIEHQIWRIGPRARP
jgi:hypothetical protein